MKKHKILLFLASGLFFFYACKNDKTKDIETIETPPNIEQKTQTQDEHKGITSTNVLETFGSFDTKSDSLSLFIPVSSSDFKVVEVKPIPSPDINAIIIRITNGDTTSILGKPATDVLKEVKSLSKLNLSISELIKDKELYVFTLNSTEKINQSELDSLTFCIGKYSDYSEIECDEDKFIPRDKRGSILSGK